MDFRGYLFSKKVLSIEEFTKLGSYLGKPKNKLLKMQKIQIY